MSDCDEFLDSMWEFVTDMGFEFYEPEYVDGSQVGEESCLYSAEEDVGEEDTPLKLTFVGFRQENALVIVGVLTLTDYDFQMPVLLAQAQSLLLGGTVAPGDTDCRVSRRRRTRSRSSFTATESNTPATAHILIRRRMSAGTALRPSMTEEARSSIWPARRSQSTIRGS
jgi:hypothetical protein